MNEEKSLRDINVGDTVFVVEQNSRHRKSEGLPRKTSSQVVARVGRKYAYIESGFRELKFCRDTGHSWHHPNENARSNGYGFDVYVSEDAYRQEQHELAEAAWLEERIISKGFPRGLRKLPPNVVEAIHVILDAEGLD